MVAGGDGTVHEVVNGLMRDHAGRAADDRPTLVPLPLGTGNDWARSLRLPHEPVELARCIVRGRTILHDVGQDRVPADPDAVHWFINVAGAGFDAHVISRLPAQTPSALAYLKSALVELGRYRSPRFRLTCDGDAPLEGRFLLAFVANAEYCGHRMHVAPTARLDDGRLDVVTIDEVGLLRALPKLLKLYRSSILSDPLVGHRVVTTVTDRCGPRGRRGSRRPARRQDAGSVFAATAGVARDRRRLNGQATGSCRARRREMLVVDTLEGAAQHRPWHHAAPIGPNPGHRRTDARATGDRFRGPAGPYNQDSRIAEPGACGNRVSPLRRLGQLQSAINPDASTQIME